MEFWSSLISTIIGAIIGAVVTILGINLTLTEQKNNQKLIYLIVIDLT